MPEPELLADESQEYKYQTDKLPELRAYVEQEGLLLKFEAMDLVDTLYLAREQLRRALQEGCAAPHLADWKRQLESVVLCVQSEPIRDMRADRARHVLTVAVQHMSAMLQQIKAYQKESKAAKQNADAVATPA
jgi:hypothetical protein